MLKFNLRKFNYSKPHKCIKPHEKSKLINSHKVINLKSKSYNLFKDILFQNKHHNVFHNITHNENIFTIHNLT